MARPLSATDDDILDAGSTVIRRRGDAGFSVSEVARDLGLSRAAITLRFKSAENLKERVLQRQAGQFEQILAQLDAVPGPEGLLEIAALIGSLAGDRLSFSLYFREYSDNLQNSSRMQMEQRRGLALQNAIARVMPVIRISPGAAAEAFRSHMTGSLLAWQASGEPDAQQFLQERTRQWMQMAGITPPPAGSAHA